MMTIYSSKLTNNYHEIQNVQQDLNEVTSDAPLANKAQ